MDFDRLIAPRARAVDSSGIRKVFELASKLRDPVNLSIGQPDFPVPDPIKNAAIDAIRADRNGYSLTQGIPELRASLRERLASDVGWVFDASPASPEVMVTSGTSGALWLLFMSILAPGDEIIVPDPYFVLYPPLATICAGKPVLCETYPDGRLTAARVEPLISPRTKAILFNSPANPTGVVATEQECADLLDLARRRNLLLISDEIYDEFCFSESRTQKTVDGSLRCPSPARFPGAQDHVALVRGFGKAYGPTGWRLGYVAAPRPLLDQMIKLQQYTFVCPPTPFQYACLEALRTDLTAIVDRFESRRDLVLGALAPLTDVFTPGGAFYAFVRAPGDDPRAASRFVERGIERGLLTIPGSVFSSRDSHFRLSFAAPEATLTRGLDILRDLLS